MKFTLLVFTINFQTILVFSQFNRHEGGCFFSLNVLVC